MPTLVTADAMAADTPQKPRASWRMRLRLETAASPSVWAALPSAAVSALVPAEYTAEPGTLQLPRRSSPAWFPEDDGERLCVVKRGRWTGNNRARSLQQKHVSGRRPMAWAAFLQPRRGGWLVLGAANGRLRHVDSRGSEAVGPGERTPSLALRPSPSCPSGE
ncbi:uncharacterized protein THITE_109868 [Thermothielavioides terrestris NRRL 8126]|uniref:Uncharacterized protein n=1 Tax=Thermothielavioides terrestris (strain ATCC 38088 / NRRL 8126) TaxID=578455 RepID=G2R170_THETT|nr:uncharacterized protein THITE_109868 [Thermothielavioides terrestris NRRL 8126]AEO67360.1 hypothetical protein THITE_109868 [Thermothielavioides terrestris NRRL 8126]